MNTQIVVPKRYNRKVRSKHYVYVRCSIGGKQHDIFCGQVHEEGTDRRVGAAVSKLYLEQAKLYQSMVGRLKQLAKEARDTKDAKDAKAGRETA